MPALSATPLGAIIGNGAPCCKGPKRRFCIVIAEESLA
jgi:hypothetical protein